MMKSESRNGLLALKLATFLVLLGALPASSLDLPWQEAGLTEEQAAAHLLNRLTFGPRPGEVDRVVEMGLETWLRQQLEARDPDRVLQSRLADLPSLNLDVREYPETYPNPGIVLREASEAGVLPEGMDIRTIDDPQARRQARRSLFEWARDRGYQSQRVLVGELVTQKLYRALYSENQVDEVLTDFWFNHFNVSLTDNQARVYVLSYERDAIRPHVLGEFGDMLEATAKHPAMLLYLDNAQSTANPGETTTMDQYMSERMGRSGRRSSRRASQNRRPPGNRPQGLNENYARELLELHTLGVDGGYSQQDVVEVARAFSGWAIYPPRAFRDRLGDRLDRALAAGIGFYAEDGFLFRADAHDAEKKKVLGKTLPAGRGMEDGEEVLEIVATHPATARHLATKLAARFVSDEPPSELVTRLAKTLQSTDGDLRQVMEVLVESPEFWDEAARHQKIKSPFELTVSALRALDAEVQYPRETVEWIGRMGQPLYSYQAPTGYPDRADFWVNSGALLHRMNFGLALAAGQIDGVNLDLAALNDHKEPESRVDALETYVPLLLPERDPTETVALLQPMVLDPRLSGKVDKAAPEPEEIPEIFDPAELELMAGNEDSLASRGKRDRTDPTALAQVVGVILGSPEFQRK
jgi:uncharacterized protein (DUF1800 family)